MSDSLVTVRFDACRTNSNPSTTSVPLVLRPNEMENEVSDSSSSSGDSAPLIIMPPPPRSDYYDAASGLNNPSNVRNLKDILDFTTKMTDNEDDVLDITLDHEVITSDA